MGLKESVYNKSLKKIIDDKINNLTLELNPTKSFLILFDGTKDDDRKKIFKFSKSLKSKGKTVKLLGYIDSKGDLTDFGMAVYNNKSINWFGFPKEHIFKLLESESFDILFNLNVGDKKHLHALACKTNANFKLSLPTQYSHNFTMILDTKEKQDIDIITEEINICLNKLSI